LILQTTQQRVNKTSKTPPDLTVPLQLLVAETSRRQSNLSSMQISKFRHVLFISTCHRRGR